MKRVLKLMPAIMAIALMPSCSSTDDAIESGTADETQKTDVYGLDSLAILPQPECISNLTFENNEVSINEAVNRFSMKLFKAAADLDDIVTGANSNGNLSISPLGVALCLGLEANAVDDATTDNIIKLIGAQSLEEYNEYCSKMMRYLPYTVWNDPKDSMYNEMVLANSAWLSDNIAFDNSFKSKLNGYYNAEIYNVDFANNKTQSIMDKWCSEKTHGKINQLPANIESFTKFVLLNALYFSSGWKSEFTEGATLKEDFYGTKSTAKVDMMHQTSWLSVSADNNRTVVKLPYVFDNYEMVVVMPGEGTDINDFSMSFDFDALQNAANNASDKYIALSMPKFIIEQNLNIQEALDAMGFPQFVNLTKAGLDESIQMYMKQKSYTGIDEDGTTIAAVTGDFPLYSDIDNQSLKPTKVEINRPFLYFVRNTVTGSILMAGRVCNI
jgi:serpin B